MAVLVAAWSFAVILLRGLCGGWLEIPEFRGLNVKVAAHYLGNSQGAHKVMMKEGSFHHLKFGIYQHG